MKTNFDAEIVGAGPAGSTASILLAKAGWRVALVEKQEFPRRKVCGECVGATNIPLLQNLGVGAAFACAAGPELLQVVLLQGNNNVVADLPPAGDGPWRWGRALGRETLDSMLLEQARLSGVQVMQPWSLQAFKGGAGSGWPESLPCVCQSARRGPARSCQHRHRACQLGSLGWSA